MTEKHIETILDKYATPLYVFDIKTLRERVRCLKSRLPDDIAICYAIKANPFVVKQICPYIDKLEVCSPGEMMICAENNVDFAKIVVSGVYKSAGFIDKMVDLHDNVDCFTVESMSQYKLLLRCADKYSKKLRLLLRLTSGSQFGLNESEIKEIISTYDKNKITINGIQYFSGTQKTSLKRLKREINYLDSFLSELKDDFGFCAEEFEFGPGFPVAYFQNAEFDEEAYLEEFFDLISSMHFKAKITLELGRSIAASCGCYMTGVVDVKNNLNQNYAIVDGGINHITYFGQSMAMKLPHHKIYPDRPEENTANWNICGSLCTTNDIIMKNTPFHNLKIGDTIIFENTGAYCMTEGISLFLSRDLPRVLLIDEQENILSARGDEPTYKLNKTNERNI